MWKSKLKSVSEAESHLTACQSQQPGFVWIYLLRGLACGERGKLGLAGKRIGEADWMGDY